jgi:hypothetical protein
MKAAVCSVSHDGKPKGLLPLFCADGHACSLTTSRVHQQFNLLGLFVICFCPCQELLVLLLICKCPLLPKRGVAASSFTSMRRVCQLTAADKQPGIAAIIRTKLVPALEHWHQNVSNV